MAILRAHILIVEDHSLYRDALARVLVGPNSAARCSGAATASQALGMLAQHFDIDLVIADLRLQHGSGMELLQTVGKRWPAVACVLLSGSEDLSLPARSRELGFMGFVPKAMEPLEIAVVIGRILSGETWFPAPENDSHTNGALTPRQTHVLACVAAVQANKHIARTLGVSERTVKYHLEEVYARLAVSNRAEAVARALERGLLNAHR